MAGRRTALRWWIAGAVSVAAHLALLLVPARDPPPPRQRPIELEVVELPPQAPEPPRRDPQPSPTRPQAQPPAQLRIGTRPPARTNAHQHAELPIVAPHAAAQRPAAGPPSTPAPGSGPAETAGIPVAPAPPPPLPRRLDLLPDRYDLAGADTPPAATEPPPAPTEPDPQHRLDALIADDKAVSRALTNVQDYWSNIRRDLDRKWAVEADLIEGGPSRGLGMGLAEGWQEYRKQAAQYAASGNPYGDDPLAPGAPTTAERAYAIGPPVPERGDEGAYRKHRTALVLVVQDASGRITDVRLHHPSGSPAYDRAAVEHARALTKLDLGLPPDGTQSVWAFDAELLITPPAPIAGCSVDAYFVPQTCFYPLSRRVRDSVRLVGVWRADETPGVR